MRITQAKFRPLNSKSKCSKRQCNSYNTPFKPCSKGQGPAPARPPLLSNPHSSRRLPFHRKENRRSIARYRSWKVASHAVASHAAGSHERGRKRTCGLAASDQPISACLTSLSMPLWLPVVQQNAKEPYKHCKGVGMIPASAALLCKMSSFPLWVPLIH